MRNGTWTVTVSGTVGLERRRTLSNPARDQKNRLYNGSLSYRPFEATTLSVSAGRDVQPSYYSGQTTLTDSWSARFEQRLLQRLFLSTSFSQSKNDYDSTTGAATPERDDKYDTFEVRLSTAIFRRRGVAAAPRGLAMTKGLTSGGVRRRCRRPR